MSKPKVVVVVGPTASGKTNLSIKLAKQYDGEVISADSRQVYRGLDLGSGKVTPEEMDGVPHHLLDIVNPMDTYTARDFKRDATNAITTIITHERLPIIAGGTFMYIDTLLGKISVPEVPPNPILRSELEAASTAELLQKLTDLDPVRIQNIDTNNRRRLIRSIEIATTLGHVPTSPATEIPYEVLTLGILIDDVTLRHNIHVRLHTRLDAGMVAEVEYLLASGVTHERLESLGLEYRYIGRHVRGEIDFATMCTEIETKSRQFAKRQMTWLKRDQSIVWVQKSDLEAIERLVKQFLKQPE